MAHHEGIHLLNIAYQIKQNNCFQELPRKCVWFSPDVEKYLTRLSGILKTWDIEDEEK